MSTRPRRTQGAVAVAGGPQHQPPTRRRRSVRPGAPGDAPPPWWPLAQALPERDLRQAIMKCAQAHGWLAYFTWRSDHSPEGYPDLTLVHPVLGKVLWMELKTEKGKLTPAQEAWLAALNAAHPDCAFVVRPRDWYGGAVEDILQGRALAADTGG